MNAIETHALTKRYGEKTAVDRLDLTVGRGEFFALLGVNGAGKTTTVRMLTGLSAPTSGDADVAGFSVCRETAEVKRRIGISPQETAVASNLTVRENLALVGGAYGLGKEASAARVREMIDLFRLDEVANSRAKTLSGGWQRKLSVAMALLPDPEILFLDEPTLGLDVLARRDLWGALKPLRGRVTVVLTTHYMEEAEALSDRIAVMIAGRIIALGTAAELEAETGTSRLEDAFVVLAERGEHHA